MTLKIWVKFEGRCTRHILACKLPFAPNIKESVQNCMRCRADTRCEMFSCFIAKLRLNDLADIGQDLKLLCATHPLMLVIICALFGKNLSRTVGVTERARDAGRTDGRIEWNQYTLQQLRCVCVGCVCVCVCVVEMFLPQISCKSYSVSYLMIPCPLTLNALRCLVFDWYL